MAFDTLRAVNRAQYSGFDFNSHFDAILAQLQPRYAEEFNDFAISSLGTYLLDLVATGLDDLSFFLDRRASDHYLVSARTRNATSRIAQFLGYKPRGAISSSTILTLVLTTPVPVATSIEPGRQFIGPAGITYEAARSVPITPSDTQVLVPVYEGTSRTEAFSASGAVNAAVSLSLPDDRFVVQGTVRVSVDGTPWEESKELTFDATNQYEVDYLFLPPRVKFGNGDTGNVPPLGATIEVTYVAGLGKAGQVGSNEINALVTDLVVLGQSIPVTLAHPAAGGGDDIESIDEIRRNAPRLNKARGVTITRSDYEGTGSSYADPLAGRVAIAQASSPRSANSDTALKTTIQAIKDEFSTLPTDTSAQLALIRGHLAQIMAQAATITAALDTLGTQTGAANADVVTLATATVTLQRSMQLTAANATDLLTQVTTVKAAVSAVPVAGSDGLTTATRDSVLGQLTRAQSLATEINNAASTANSDLAANVTTLQVLADRFTGSTDPIGISTTSGNLGVITAANNDVIARVGVPSTLTTLATGIYAPVEAIEVLIVTEGSSRLTTVSMSLQELYEHVDRILAADCKANLVQVSILARDAAGFYAAPSVSLMQSLQVALTGTKEVTQVVQVVSGASALISPVLLVRIGVREGFSQSLIEQGALAAIDAALRERQFGDSLYLSDLTDAILALDGVGFVNVVISGYQTSLGLQTDKLDVSGNLIITPDEVITRAFSSTLTLEAVRTIG